MNNLKDILLASNKVIPHAIKSQFENSISPQTVANLFELYNIFLHLVEKYNLSNHTIEDIPYLPKSYKNWNTEGLFKYKNYLCAIVKIEKNLSSYAFHSGGLFAQSSAMKEQSGTGYYFTILEKVDENLTNGQIFYSPCTFSFFMTSPLFFESNIVRNKTEFIIPFLVLSEFLKNQQLEVLWVTLALKYLNYFFDTNLSYKHTVENDAELELANKYFQIL